MQDREREHREREDRSSGASDMFGAALCRCGMPQE